MYDQVGMPIMPGRECVDEADAAGAQAIRCRGSPSTPEYWTIRDPLVVQNGVRMVGASSDVATARRRSPTGVNPDRGREWPAEGAKLRFVPRQVLGAARLGGQ